MKEEFKIISFEKKEKEASSADFLNLKCAETAQKFHSSFDEYKETPLVSLDNLAQNVNLSAIFVKDESYRFGLNAFKVLGGSYAIGNYIADRLNESIDNMSFKKIISKEVIDKLGDITFITATDGNHGRGVAWTANKLKKKSKVYMPKGSSKERLNNIISEGADACILDKNYDEAVRYANDLAEKNNWVMVQDTAWEGYYDIPKWIMQGYTTMAYEAYKEIPEKPTHIFIQAGVGALAGAVTGFFSNVYKDDKPIITVVEPNKADCIYRTAEANNGELQVVTGDMDTIMVGLACGEPNPIGWRILNDYCDNFVSCPDYVSAKGMRVLGNPLDDDKRVISGESGAVCVGLVVEVMTNHKLEWLKKKLKLDENSRVLCFSTEGDTDKENYRKITWDGKNPSFEKGEN